MDLRTDTTRTGPRATSGFTLVESVMVLVVLGIVGLSSSYVVLESMKVYARTAPAIDASYHARLAAERLRRDIRDLLDPASISAFTATDFDFVTTAGIPVRYRFSAGELARNGATLAQGLSGFEFRYRDAGGAPALTPADLHLVDVRFVASRRGQSEPLSMAVFPRVLRR